VTAQSLPAGRYGPRARGRPRRRLRWLIYGLALLASVVGCWVSYLNFGITPISGQQTTYQVLNDHSVSLTVSVQREYPNREAECVVRALDQSGAEVARKEVLIPAGANASTQETVLQTTKRAVTGEVYGCTYNVPSYLQHSQRPTG
jgi:hypothetical protein